MLKQGIQNTQTPAASWLDARKRAAAASRKRDKAEARHCSALRKLVGIPLGVRACDPTAPDGDYPANRRATLLRVAGRVAVVTWDGADGRTETWMARDLVAAESWPTHA